jgi:hypothetical protein
MARPSNKGDTEYSPLAFNVPLDEVLKRVAARGGPVAPWTVDLKKRSATLAGVMVVYFHPSPDGHFSPAWYGRIDRAPNQARDLPLVEDAMACIAEEIAHAGPGWQWRL